MVRNFYLNKALIHTKRILSRFFNFIKVFFIIVQGLGILQNININHFLILDLIFFFTFS